MARRTAQTLSKRDLRESRRKRERVKNYLIWGGVAVLVVGVLAAAVLIGGNAGTAVQGASVGDFVAAPSRDHVAEGTKPGPFPSDPPAGGAHYPSTLKSGFYDEAAAAAVPQYPEGFLVHNLEHGYVIYWYNCQANTSINCDDLKNAIKQVQKEFNERKTIAFPWPSLKTPLAITSWERVMRLDNIDLDKMRLFYRSNLNKSPEPNAD